MPQKKKTASKKAAVTKKKTSGSKSKVTKKAPAKKAPAKKAPAKKAPAKKAAAKEVVDKEVKVSLSAAKKVDSPAVSAPAGSGDGSMEEALRDLDRMMAVEDSTYHLDSSESKKGRDFGAGLGDMLAGQDQLEAVDKEEDELVTGTKGGERLSVESILQDQDEAESAECIDTEEEVLSRPVRAVKKRKSRFLLAVPILVFVLALLLVANGLGLFGDTGARLGNSLLSMIGMGQSEMGDLPSNMPATSQPSVVSLNVLLSTGSSGSDVSGSLVTRAIATDVQLSDSFPATGETVSDEARSLGTLTVFNETSRDYHFVSTTRFLSEEGILFRLKSATDIPAGGSVDVEVYADETGPEGDIGPSSFTIPGLSESLQESVYGRSELAMTGGSGMVSAVSADDLESARADLMERLREEAVENFSLMLEDGEKVLADLITSKEVDLVAPEEDTPSSSFEMDLTMEFRTLVMPEEAVLELLEEQAAGTTEGESLGSFQLGDLLYSVEAYDTVAERAEVRVESSLYEY